MAEINPLTSLGESINALVQEAVQKATGTNQAQAAAPTQQPQQQESPVTPPTPGTATSTDVSQTSGGLVKKTNMKTGEYVSPYQAEQQQLAEQLQGAKLPDTSAATQNYVDSLFSQQTQDFEYDIEKDPLVAKAKENVQQVVMDMANKRGFLYGSYESDIVAQQMEKLAPQFEQMAYDKNSDYLNRQLGLASTMMKWEKIQFDRSKNAIELLRTKLDFFNKLDDREFNVFKTMLDHRNAQRTLSMQERKFDLQKQAQLTSQALDRLENLGYVDNQASIILGFPVGAKAKWVQQAAMEHQNKLELMAKENEYNLIKQKLDADMEKEVYALKTRLDEASKMKYMAMEYQYKKELLALENNYNVSRAQIAAAKAAASARSSGGGGGGGRSSGGGSGVSAADARKYSKLDTEYKNTATAFMKKFGNKKKYGQDAAKYLDNLRRAGVSSEVLLRMKSEFKIPNMGKSFKGVNWATGELI
jgi:uncharacterized membrane protein YgcG